MTRRIALVLEYDGRGFHGWQSQEDGNTVQDALERALSVVADAPVRTLCAGRTDTGVHARGQVVHFDTDAERPLTAWVRGVNAHLPGAVAVLQAAEVNEEFHARFSATGRRYRYLLLNRSSRPGLLAGRVGWYHRLLDAAAMQAAATCLIGRQDFSAFRSSECQAKSPVRSLHAIRLQRNEDILRIDLHADGFLHHMVRNIVGCLVAVGNGSRPPEWLAAVLAGRDRSKAAPTFDAAGLYLTGVDYDARWSLKVDDSGTGPSLLPELP